MKFLYTYFTYILYNKSFLSSLGFHCMYHNLLLFYQKRSNNSAKRNLFSCIPQITIIYLSRKQFPHKWPPYERVTVLRRFETDINFSGRSAMMPRSLQPYCPQTGTLAGFFGYKYTSLPPGVLELRKNRSIP